MNTKTTTISLAIFWLMVACVRAQLSIHGGSGDDESSGRNANQENYGNNESFAANGAVAIQAAPTTARPTTARPPTPPPIHVELSTPTTRLDNILGVINASAVTTPKVTAKPTQKPTQPATTKQTPKPPIAPTKPPTAPNCSADCILSYKTGLYADRQDLCGYISCIRTDTVLYCAKMKCDKGYAFSEPSLRCIQSNLCGGKAPPK